MVSTSQVNLLWTPGVDVVARVLCVFPGMGQGSSEKNENTKLNKMSLPFSLTLNMPLNTSAAGYATHLGFMNVRGKISSSPFACINNPVDDDGHIFYHNIHTFNVLIMWSSLAQRLVSDVLDGGNALLQRHKDEIWFLPHSYR